MTSAHGPGAGAATATAPAPPKVPYRGIEPFRYLDRQIFFVRGEETRSLLRHVALYRGVLLYGDSGAGKSSLVNAGLVPAALEEGFTPDRLRVQPRTHGEIIVERLPSATETGLPYLPSTFAADDDPSARTVLSVRAFSNTLKYLPAHKRPLLIFDQFEEFVTLFEEAPTGPALAEARGAQQAILEVLVEVLRDQTLPVKVLLAFREDYLAKLSGLFALCPDLPDQYVRLLPPRVTALPRIIRGPFEAFPGHFKQELSPALAADLAAAVAERSEAGKLNLSEIQIACLGLWQSDNPDALFARKGIGGLLEDYLDDSLYRLDTGLRDPATALLSRMVTSSGTRNVISREDLISLVHNEDDIPGDLLQKALAALERQTRLVRRERRHDTYFYEIVSEFLIPWISVQREARARERAAHNERRKRRRAYFVAAVFALIAMAVSFAAYVWVQRNRQAVMVEKAEAERDEALGERDDLAEKLRRSEKAREEAARQLEVSKINEEISKYVAADANNDMKAVYAWIPTYRQSLLVGTQIEYPPTASKNRQAITIYYERWRRSGAADVCWSSFGFRRQGSAVNSAPSNIESGPSKILCGANVGRDEIKLVAICLMQADIEVTDIGPLREQTSEVRVVHGVPAMGVAYNVEGLNRLPDNICSGGQ